MKRAIWWLSDLGTIMLENLLKYHQNLISDDFVKGVMARIEKVYQTRVMILGLCSIVGMAIVLVALNSFMKISWYQTFERYFFDAQFLVYFAAALLVIFTVCTRWLFDDGEFS